jgi:hypothetical protein
MVLTATRRIGSYSYTTHKKAVATYLNWGKGKPPQWTFGDCVVAWRAAMYKQDCQKQAHFACEKFR